MPALEFLKWEEYFSIYPFTQDREDMRNAKLCATIVNMSGKQLKKGHIVNVSDFLPSFFEEAQVQKRDIRLPTLEEQQYQFLAFTAKVKALKGSKQRKPL